MALAWFCAKSDVIAKKNMNDDLASTFCDFEGGIQLNIIILMLVEAARVASTMLPQPDETVEAEWKQNEQLPLLQTA